MSALASTVDPPFHLAGETAALLSALLWATIGIVFVSMRPAISAAALNLGKNAAATLCFVALLWIVRGSPWPAGLDGEAVIIFAASGVLGLALCDTFLLRSLLGIGPQRTSVIFLLVPVLAALVAMLPPFNEQAPWLTWAGMLVCLAGIALAIKRPPHFVGDPSTYWRGAQDAFLAAGFQTGAVLLARHGLAGAEAPLLESALVRMGAGTSGLLLMGLVGGGLGRWVAELRPRPTWVTVFWASFFGTFLGILTNQAGLKWAVHTGVATTLNSLMPIFLVPLSMVFLGERFGARGVIATLVAVAGVAVMMLA
jgi:drug/metabolite transporter (DMT)-like permease